MKRYFGLILLLFILGISLPPSSLYAASNQDPLNLLNDKQDSADKTPNIRDLSSRWWNQYKELEEAKTFEDQFQKFIKKLESAVNEVEGEQRGELLERIAIIRNLAQEYKKLKYSKKNDLDIPKALILKETYSVKDYLEVNQLRLQVDFLLKQTQEEIDENDPWEKFARKNA